MSLRAPFAGVQYSVTRGGQLRRLSVHPPEHPRLGHAVAHGSQRSLRSGHSATTLADQQLAHLSLEPSHLPDAQAVDVAEVYAMLDQLGDVARHLNSRTPERITQVYRDLGLQVVYDNKKRRSR